LEAGYIRSDKAVKRTIRKPKTYNSLSGLELKGPKIQLNYKAEKEVRSFLKENFNGPLATVKTCYELFPARHALFGLAELLESIFCSYNSPFEQKYRVRYYDEKQW
jgi:hypothetical protein